MARSSFNAQRWNITLSKRLEAQERSLARSWTGRGIRLVVLTPVGDHARNWLKSHVSMEAA